MTVKSIVTGLCVVLCMIGCSRHERTLVSEAYPGFKWGFTTQNFIAATPVSPESAKAFVSYAKTQGYDWIELRDPDASLTLDECRDIAAYARANGIAINYSVQRGLLSSDFWEVFERGVLNTAAFDGPRYFRTLALADQGQFGWKEDEFRRAVTIANEAAARAAQQGVRFTVENADVTLDGTDKPYYGLTEFFDQTHPNVTLQLDTANLFTGPTVVTPDEAGRFIEKYASRISYLHLKSAKDGKALAVLEANPLDFKTILSMVHGNVSYIAIELAGESNERRIYENMADSLAYLARENLISVR